MSRFLILPIFLFMRFHKKASWIIHRKSGPFANGLINTTMNERDIAVSPDGNEIFYSVFIPASRFHTIIHLSKNPHGKTGLVKKTSF